MYKKNLFPLVLFCIVFLIFSIYFVKVVNTSQNLEPNSIAKTVKRVIDNKNKEAEKAADVKADKIEQDVVLETGLKEPLKRYVNYVWLNIRKKPTLASTVIEKLNKGDEVLVLSYPTSSWAYIKSNSGARGYVASRYLGDKPVKVEVPEEVVVTESYPVPETPVVSEVENENIIFDVPIITYHHISNDTASYSPGVVLPEVNFIAQLDYLVANGFKTYTFYDLKNIVDNKSVGENKDIILTFNGGYDDAYLASQHLNGKGMKGVFFISTNKVGTAGHLDWRQIKKMRSWGMEIASQGVNGANLVTSSDYYINDEIKRSKADIEIHLGEKILSFGYPYGSYNNAIIDVVKEAGYSFARSNDSGSRYTIDQLYNLPTLRVFFPAGANQFRVWLEE